LLAGKIIISSGVRSIEIPVSIGVRSENFLFDSSITLDKQYRTVLVGKNLFANINLAQVGPQEKVDVGDWTLFRGEYEGEVTFARDLGDSFGLFGETEAAADYGIRKDTDDKMSLEFDLEQDQSLHINDGDDKSFSGF